MSGSDPGAPVAPARRYDAVVFDFSGVVVESAFDALALVAGDDLDRDAVLELLLGPYDRDTDHVWHRVERGEVSIVEWVAHVDREAAAAGLTIDWDRIQAMLGQLAVHDPMVTAIRTLRSAGYATALCTNNVREAAAGWRAMLPLDELFDVVVDSSAVGLRKPDVRIYQLVLDQLGGVDPARAVFLDDHPGNVAGAEAAGLTGLLVADVEAALRDLADLLDDPALAVMP